MHAVAPAPDPILTRQPFTDATSRVNAWRGRCLDAFTRAETAVTETLAVMAAVEGKGGQVGLPHLVGQRLEALKVVILEGGAFQAEGGRAALILNEFSQYLGLRNMLCHGIARVTLDAQGHWTVVMRLATLRSRQVCREMLAFTEDEADALQGRIIRIGQSLSSQLGQIRANLK